MTAKTGKDRADEVDEVEAVPAEERAEAGEAAEPAAAPARPAAKRKRRVRVIEVIDDEDLDEVLEALDAEDAQAEEAGEEAPARPARPAEPEAVSVEKPAAKAAPKPKPKPRPAQPAEEAEDAASGAAPRPGLFGLPLLPTVVFVVLVALLASVAIWKWTSASSLSSEQDERDAIGDVASAYGNVAYNYNPTNYQTQTDKALKLLAGDMLDDYKKNTVPTVASAFQADPQVALTSKTNQVFVGSVNGKFATAVLMMDMALKTKDGTINQPATLLRLSLSKIDGKWKITQQYPSGINDQNRNQQQGQIPGVPNGGATQSPKPGKTEKPKN
ncbi:hypothetical protein AB0C74_17260 [Spirillospora sp. NPDC048832]